MLPWSSNEGGGGGYISDDILFVIFLFLPADSIIRFRFVCKYWFNLITSINISNPRFVHKHMHHHHNLSYHATTTDKLPTILSTTTSTLSIPNHSLYSLNNNHAIEIVYPFQSRSSQLEILGSCNGLLCIQVTDYNDHMGFTNTSNPRRNIVYPKGILCLWNPSTKEFKLVPAEGIIKPGHSEVKVMYGFGYDRLINDYKLVRFVGLNNYKYDGLYFSISQVQVYTLGTNSWKMIDKEMPSLLRLSTMKVMSPSVMMGTSYVNGALHWISKDGNRIIYSFNIEDEEFRVVPKPNCLDQLPLFGAGLQELRGCLCIFNSHIDQYSEVQFEVWMMRDYGVKESWTKLFRVKTSEMSLSRNLRPLWMCKNGGTVLIGHGTEYSFPDLVIYDPNDDDVEFICSQRIHFNLINTTVHIGSLVSLKSGTYVDQEEVEMNKKNLGKKKKFDQEEVGKNEKNRRKKKRKEWF